MRLNELLSVTDLVASKAVFVENGKEYEELTQTHDEYMHVYDHSELYTVQFVWAKDSKVYIQVEY